MRAHRNQPDATELQRVKVLHAGRQRLFEQHSTDVSPCARRYPCSSMSTDTASSTDSQWQRQ